MKISVKKNKVEKLFGSGLAFEDLQTVGTAYSIQHTVGTAYNESTKI